MKLYLKLIGLTVILMYCVSPLIAVDFNDFNFNGEKPDNVSGIDVINNISIEKNEINNVAQDLKDDGDVADFNVYVNNCSYGQDLQVFYDGDYKYPMNVSFVLYNAAGYPIYNVHNCDVSCHGNTVIPADILFYRGDYKIKAVFECENYTVEKTVSFNVH